MKAKAIQRAIISFLVSILLNAAYILYLHIRFASSERGILVGVAAMILYVLMLISSGLSIFKDRNTFNIPGLNRANFQLQVFQLVCLAVSFGLFLFGELITNITITIGNTISIIAINLIGLTFLIFCPVILVNTLYPFTIIGSISADFIDG